MGAANGSGSWERLQPRIHCYGMSWERPLAANSSNWPRSIDWSRGRSYHRAPARPGLGGTETGCCKVATWDGAWRSLVAHLLWEQRVGGSNPSAPTNRFPGESINRAAHSAAIQNWQELSNEREILRL